MGGNPEKIQAHYGQKATLSDALANLPSPGTLVFWTGVSRGNLSQNEIYQHHLGAYVRAATAVNLENSGLAAYYLDIVPVLMGSGVARTSFVEADLLPGRCFPPNIPEINIVPDTKRLEFLEIFFDVVEIGDQ